jgi:hypothetical protein
VLVELGGLAGLVVLVGSVGFPGFVGLAGLVGHEEYRIGTVVVVRGLLGCVGYQD